MTHRGALMSIMLTIIHKRIFENKFDSWSDVRFQVFSLLLVLLCVFGLGAQVCRKGRETELHRLRVMCRLWCRWRRSLLLTCGLSKVEFRGEVETRCLFLKNLQMRVFQRAVLCCRTSQILIWFSKWHHVWILVFSLTEKVQVSALFAVPVWALGHGGVCPQDAVGARGQVKPLMLVDGGVEMNCHRQTGDGRMRSENS